MMQAMKVFAVLGFVVALTEPFGARSSVEWARFRGPNGSGIADDDKPPIAFGPSERRLWKTAVPRGHSSPIVWNDHIFITAVDDGALVTLALRRKDGTVLWRRVAPTRTIEPVHPFNYPAAPTAATDGERVYVYFGSYGVLAYDFSGTEMWRQPLPLLPMTYGTATSPIVFGGKIILQRDGNSTESELLALNAKTGEVVWRTPRPLLRSSWSTPIIWSHNGREEIVTVGTHRIVAYSGDGAEQWWVSGLGEQPINVAVSGSDMLFVSATYTGSPSDPVDIPKWEAMIDAYDADKDGRLALGELSKDAGILLRREVPKETPGNFLPLTRVLQLADANKDDILTKAEWDEFLGWVRANEDKVLAIRPGGEGDITKGLVAWTGNRGLSEIPSPLFYQGRLYFVRSGGMVTSYAPDTGKIILDRQRLGALGQYVASPVAADGRIYVANELGTVVVFRAGDSLDVLARNDLQENITATPAIADNKLYIRTAGHLWAFGE
jgi:outer membrane protein assembly factor BamB